MHKKVLKSFHISQHCYVFLTYRCIRFSLSIQKRLIILPIVCVPCILVNLLVVIFLHITTNNLVSGTCVFVDRVNDTAAIKASVGSCSKLQLAEDDLLIVNVSTRGMP